MSKKIKLKIKNKSTIIGILVFILVLAGIFAVKSVISSDEGKAIYGTRLDGIEDVQITQSTKDKVVKAVSDSSKSTEVTTAGRIINIIIKAKDTTSLEEAKKLGDKCVEAFSTKEKKYYDIQIFITNTKNKSQFPIIGYKHHNNEKITWSKDRAEN